MAGNNKRFDAKLGASLNKLGLGSRRGGGPSPGPSRLPSLKPSRDLTLGAPKRTFVPNIPSSRPNIKEETKDRHQPQERDAKQRDDGFNRNQGRGRGRGRGRGEIITAASIFSHGPALQPKHAAAAAYGSRSTGEVSVTSTRSGSKHVEEFEESKEFMDMLQEEGKFRLDTTDSATALPVILPLLSTKLSRKEEDGDADIDAAMLSDDAQLSNDVEMKSPGHSPPARTVAKKQHVTAATEEVHDVTAAELFGTTQQAEQLLFFQFPDVLPIKPLSTENTPEEPTSNADGATPTQQTGAAKNGQSTPVVGDTFSLKNVSEGYIGKLQVHKSGKVKLVLGNAKLDVSMSIPCGFLQDLVSINKTDEKANMTCLGHVSHRILCTPDYEALLGSTVAR